MRSDIGGSTEVAAPNVLSFIDKQLKDRLNNNENLHPIERMILKKLSGDEPGTGPTYAILDDVYWLEAGIHLKKGEFNEALALYERIMKEYAEDVLADDAFFAEGDLYQHQLNNKEKAMEIYREFLNKFPGSVYAAEARKRFRFLRGDFNNQEPVN